MQATLNIARRQFASYFNGPIAYIVICVVLLLTGYFFWNTFFLYGRASVRDLFTGFLAFPTWLMIAVPALTMGLVAEERRSGTIELLLTFPVRDSDVILGKFLGVLGLYVVLLALTLPAPFSVASLGPLDWGQVSAGYLGLFLQGSAMIAVGLLVSSWTENQIVAFFVSLATLFGFWVIDKSLPLFPTGVASVLEWFSFDYHLQSMTRGVVDSRDVLFFFCVMGFALMFAFRSLESRRWR